MWLLGGVALASGIVAGWLLWSATAEAPARNVQLQRLTDLVGMEESPAISPDGKAVAFVARAGSKRQIWHRMLAGGPPLQITRDDTDHERPRWVPDSSALIYYAPSATPGEHGAIWEVPALGGEPRRIASALSSGDISHDGRRIALFRFEETQMALVVVNRDGSGPDYVRPLPLRAASSTRAGRQMIAGLPFIKTISALVSTSAFSSSRPRRAAKRKRSRAVLA